MDEIKKKIAELAHSIAAEYGVHFLDVELAGSMRKPIVRVFIDRENGVSLDDCEKFSNAFSAILDVEDLIHTSYVLEVSSPGLDRPLKGVKEFERNVGKLIRIVTKDSVNKQNFFIGRIIEVNNDKVKLSIGKKKEINISFDNISKSRLEIEFK